MSFSRDRLAAKSATAVYADPGSRLNPGHPNQGDGSPLGVAPLQLAPQQKLVSALVAVAFSQTAPGDAFSMGVFVASGQDSC